MKNPKKQFEEIIARECKLITPADSKIRKSVALKCQSISDQQSIDFAKWYDDLLTPGIGRDPEISIEEYFTQFKQEFYS